MQQTIQRISALMFFEQIWLQRCKEDENQRESPCLFGKIWVGDDLFYK
jgi:hypothetical protein